jgi:Delta3-Delta2-enoyl-CoA isomerase
MINIHKHGAVRVLQLYRPPVNALAPDLMNELREAVEEAAEESLGGLVLSGMPGMFSAGLDVPHLLTLDRVQMADVWRDFYALLRTLAASPIPVAAAITGHSPAGGAVLALFCDWRIAAEGKFKIGLNEVAVGLTLPPVILSALQRLVGFRQAERLAVGGLLLSPEEALANGLVDHLCPVDQVTGRAVAWVQSLLDLPRDAMATTRRKARADLVQIFDRDIPAELSQVTEMWWSPQTQDVLFKLVEQLASKKSKP